MRVVRKIFEFEWDKGNIDKNKKHKVKDKEVEEVFFDDSKVIYKDRLHSKHEDRFIALGRTKEGRVLYVVFTKRDKPRTHDLTARLAAKRARQGYSYN